MLPDAVPASADDVLTNGPLCCATVITVLASKVIPWSTDGLVTTRPPFGVVGDRSASALGPNVGV